MLIRFFNLLIIEKVDNENDCVKSVERFEVIGGIPLKGFNQNDRQEFFNSVNKYLTI